MSHFRWACINIYLLISTLIIKLKTKNRCPTESVLTYVIIDIHISHHFVWSICASRCSWLVPHPLYHLTCCPWTACRAQGPCNSHYSNPSPPPSHRVVLEPRVGPVPPGPALELILGKRGLCTDPGGGEWSHPGRAPTSQLQLFPATTTAAPRIAFLPLGWYRSRGRWCPVHLPGKGRSRCRSVGWPLSWNHSCRVPGPHRWGRSGTHPRRLL